MGSITITARIRCINKSDRDSPYERITRVGGINSNGGRWALSQEEAISGIESGKYAFFVEVGGDRANVIVRISRLGNKYLTTEADGDLPNNLLSLPECP